MPYFPAFPVGSNAPETVETKTRRAYCVLRRDAIARGHTFALDRSATNCLAMARRQVADGTAPKYDGPRIWAGLGGSDGKTFAAYGEPVCRWIENPESKGLRLVGLAHDCGNYYNGSPVEHRGWYMNEFGDGETVSGVVYRLPGKGGRARYLYGYADPHNTDKEGNGPALLSMDMVTGEPLEYDEFDDAIFDAARHGDSMAETMAEQEREYQTAWSNGGRAREKANEATQAACAYVETVRTFRDVWANRHTLRRQTVRQSLDAIRAACGEFHETRAAAHSFRDEHAPAKPRPHFHPEYAKQLAALSDAFCEGYDNAF